MDRFNALPASQQQVEHHPFPQSTKVRKHIRHRHAPLLCKTEWIEAMCVKPTPKGVNKPRINYAPLTHNTALHSHPLTDEDRAFARDLTARNHICKVQNEVDAMLKGLGLAGTQNKKSCGVKAMAKSVGAGLKSMFSCADADDEWMG
ncbi:hypothetical protein MMC28_005145 [Mycoblastus sanguinarius]|nr:hypothetical protein [Mycoblastus sanguinarius]